LDGLKEEREIKSPKVSIVIPTHNRKDDLIECLESVINLDYLKYEVIVVDNASADGTYAAVRKKFPRIKVITNKENLGVSGGRNIGLKSVDSQSEYILFLDHDVVLSANLLSELLRVIIGSGDIGIATPKIYYYSHKKVIWSTGTSINLVSGRVSFNGGNKVDHGQFDKIRDVQVAPAVILVKKEVIEKIGGFDEIYFATYEDTDFCFRARKSGYRVVYVPGTWAYHKIPLDWLESMNRLLSRAYYVGRNRLIFMRKHSKYFPLFLMFLPVYFFYYSCLSLWFRKVKEIGNFCKGTMAGLLFAVRNGG